MANRKKYKLKGWAKPTHILIPEDHTENELTLYLCDDGAAIFCGAKNPEGPLPLSTYKLLPIDEYYTMEDEELCPVSII